MTQVSILFVCLGNICRSPTAEAIFLKILEREHASARFTVDSAGLLGYHQGELPDSRMRYHAGKRGYSLTHRSRPFSQADFDRFDMIVGMDDQNIAGLKQLAMTQEEEGLLKNISGRPEETQRILPIVLSSLGNQTYQVQLLREVDKI